MELISTLAIAKCFQNLYDKSRDASDTDYNIIGKDGSEIPVHSFVLKARYRT